MVKHDQAFERGLWDVREGRETFAKFVRATRSTWEALAKYLLRRWRVGAWADQEDVVQDLLLGAWEVLWRYEPGHANAPTLGGYVVYNALDKAKKRGVHHYRGASLSGNADANPSHVDLLASQVWGDDADRKLDAAGTSPPEQEDAVSEREVITRALKTTKSAVERRVVETAATTGEFRGFCVGDDLSLAICAQALYGDAPVRRECKLRTEEQALRAVVKASRATTLRLLAA